MNSPPSASGDTASSATARNASPDSSIRLANAPPASAATGADPEQQTQRPSGAPRTPDPREAALARSRRGRASQADERGASQQRRQRLRSCERRFHRCPDVEPERGDETLQGDGRMRARRAGKHREIIDAVDRGKPDPGRERQREPGHSRPDARDDVAARQTLEDMERRRGQRALERQRRPSRMALRRDKRCSPAPKIRARARPRPARRRDGRAQASAREETLRRPAFSCLPRAVPRTGRRSFAVRNAAGWFSNRTAPRRRRSPNRAWRRWRGRRETGAPKGRRATADRPKARPTPAPSPMRAKQASVIAAKTRAARQPSTT